MTPNNPKKEWNMDSWNNNRGREIAKEYGNGKFYSLPKGEQEDIIAQKVMIRMKNGDLITDPNDKRKYRGKAEKPTEYGLKFLKKIEEINEIIEKNKPKLQSSFNKKSSYGYNHEWTKEDHLAFLEGFDTGVFTEHGKKMYELEQKLKQKRKLKNNLKIGNPGIDKVA